MEQRHAQALFSTQPAISTVRPYKAGPHAEASLAGSSSRLIAVAAKRCCTALPVPMGRILRQVCSATRPATSMARRLHSAPPPQAAPATEQSSSWIRTIKRPPSTPSPGQRMGDSPWQVWSPTAPAISTAPHKVAATSLLVSLMAAEWCSSSIRRMVRKPCSTLSPGEEMADIPREI